MPGSIIASQVFGLVTATGALTAAGMAVAFAINLVASRIIASAASPDMPTETNLGNRQQVPPAGSNKLPVVYGSAYVGGIITDLTISNDNQTMYYCLALSEVTNTQTGAGDNFTFGNIYWGGKRCVFDGTDQTRVVSLLDESTGESQTNVDGNLFIYLYRNGSNQPVNSTTSAITVMSSAGLAYTWDSSKLMSNCAFAIIKLVYNQDAGLTSIAQTRFQINNPRSAPGDCFSDFLQSTRYGAGIPASQIDTASLTALNAYCAENFAYAPYSGGGAYIPRFRFDGVIDPSNTVMANMQSMAASCDCLLRYNELTAKWGVIVQQPAYTVAMAISDSNMVSGIQITPTDLSSTPNIVESKFANGTEKDTFASAVFSLAQIAPALLYPNEPVNKQSVTLPLVNNDVRAQYIAQRLLKAGREDLIVKVTISYAGLQLEAGDIVTLTSANYGWTNKLFRVSQVVETFTDDGQITAALTLMEFNPAVFDDASITQFTPAPNTGIPTPLVFGTLYAPTVVNLNPSAAIPSFGLAVTAASSGICQYAEVWYSAYSNPSPSQRIFAGTTAVQAAGNPYTANSSMGVVTISNIPQGNWYFSVRYVNSIGTSSFSASSSVLKWRPLTFQYAERYLAVAYADNDTGTSGFSYSPRNKAYFGLYNNSTANGGTDPTLYKWFLSPVNFGAAGQNYLLYANRTNRKFSFNAGNAGYVNLGGAFVPTETSVYDTTVWSGLIDPTSGNQSFIDLDMSTGQTIINGYSSPNQNDGFLSITNTTNGQMRVNLQQFLNFGSGIYTKSFNAATLTIDVYGRVVGFSEQDQFFYTETIYTATAGQTTFSNTHTVGWILVFRDGLLLSPSDYSETSTSVVLNNACAAGETVIVIYMRGVSTSAAYVQTNMSVVSSTTNTVTYNNPPWQIINAGDQLTFSDTGTPTAYTVQSINTTTKVITFTTSISGATAGNGIYAYRAAGSNYAPFSRYETSVSGITSYTPTTWSIQNGAESIYVNGCQISEIDYNITGAAIDGFPAPLTGLMTVILYAPNNLNVPASNIVNVVAYSTAGQTTYPFQSNPLSMEVYANGAILAKGASYDYTASASNFILNTAFDNNITLLNQQTFARNGAA